MRRDYSNFKSSYEEQLRNKIALGNKYKFQIIEHFEIKYGTKIAKPERYKIEGIFIINAPTVYMYNSHFPTLTLKNLEELLSGTYETKQFRLTDINGSEHLIGVPLFDSVASIDRFTKLGLISPNDD
jgi:hypothetical protein